MNWILARSLLLFAAIIVLPAEQHRLRLGEKAPSLPDAGRRNGQTAVIFLPTGNTASCRSWLDALEQLRSQLGKRNVLITAVVPDSEAKWQAVCPDTPQTVSVVYDPDRNVANLYGTAQGQRVGILTDEQGIVRRIVRASGVSQFASTLAGDIKAWEEGKGIYEATCARCHGSDGANTGYAEIKTLNGIGNRMDEAEIIRRTSLTSNVDLSSFNDARFRALAIYVAGL